MMLRIQQSIKRNGSSLPRSIALKLNRPQTIQKVQFTRYNAVKNIDAYDNIPDVYPQNVKARSPIKEVIFAGDSLIVVTASGMARAYNLYSGRLLSNLNPTPNDSVQTVVYNRYNDTLIIVYAAQPGQLQCAVYSLEALMRGNTREVSCGYVFGCVVLRHPGFFEFDDVNGRIGAAILQEQRYQFWDMKTYKKVFEINGHGDKYHEMRVSDGLLAMFKLPTGGFIPVSLFDIKDGRRLVTDASIEIDPHRDMVLLELCCEYLLLKQKGSCLRIFDLLRNNVEKVKGTRHFHPIGFVFYDYSHSSSKHGLSLNTTRQFMTISANMLEFWQLADCQVCLFRKIDVPGLLGPELVSHNNSSNIVAAYTSAVSETDELPIPFIFQSAKDFFAEQKEKDVQEELSECSTNDSCATDLSVGLCVDLLAPSKCDVKPLAGVHLFDMFDGECLGVLNEFDDNVQVLSNALDKHTLAAGCSDGVVRLVRMPTPYDEQESAIVEQVQNTEPFQGLFTLQFSSMVGCDGSSGTQFFLGDHNNPAGYSYNNSTRAFQSDAAAPASGMHSPPNYLLNHFGHHEAGAAVSTAADSQKQRREKRSRYIDDENSPDVNKKGRKNNIGF